MVEPTATACVRATRRRYLALDDLLHYALNYRIYHSRMRHAPRRPERSPHEEPAQWWRFAAAAVVDEAAYDGAAPARLDASLLRRRREYIRAYQVALLAEMGGPPLSKQQQLRLAYLEATDFSVGQVLAFRGLAAASAKAPLLALQRKQRQVREKQRRERERKLAEERRRQQELERREAERQAQLAAREARVAVELERRAERREAKRREKEEQLAAEAREREERDRACADAVSRGERSPSLSASFLSVLSSSGAAMASLRSEPASPSAARAHYGSPIQLSSPASSARSPPPAPPSPLDAGYHPEAAPPPRTGWPTQATSAAARLQALARTRQASRALRARRVVALRVQSYCRRRRAHAWYRRLRGAISRVQTVWRGVMSRRAFARLKTALLLDESVACDAMRLLLALRERHIEPPHSARPRSPRIEVSHPVGAPSATASPSLHSSPSLPSSPSLHPSLHSSLHSSPPSSPAPSQATMTVTERPNAASAVPVLSRMSTYARLVPARALELFHAGLRANDEGRTTVACELMQRSAAIAGVASLNIVLSLANMYAARARAGRHAAAAPAYPHPGHIRPLPFTDDLPTAPPPLNSSPPLP